MIDIRILFRGLQQDTSSDAHILFPSWSGFQLRECSRRHRGETYMPSLPIQRRRQLEQLTHRCTL